MNQGVTVIDHPLVQHKLTWMRRKETSSPNFRTLLREISLLMAYELTRDLPLTDQPIETPVSETIGHVIDGKKFCLISILRAGNGLLEGMLDLVPNAVVGHIGLYRDHETLEAIEYYFKVPGHLEERRVIVVDPMLATGHTSVAAITRLKKAGAQDIRFACLLAAPEGIKEMRAAHPDVPIFTASIDECLNENSYIVPGLGDAGDRIYGTK
ncbi:MULTISPECIES: uracil phosphoribosyltransferase [Limibacillus]|jgi:uracil phosphoribosyltransferase|uniref:Uracil phosphoribosyltransferase n=1 Tax=Limibacillus halophilus TaxID=1579333 RepID=A0A839STZ5_9PROT|nr:uracil phosphoribosyltransferase [Limibacillus halophilus]MBB3065808.1 uracil phosphoribosyltransferase [Limibacillus halophilus]